MEKNMIKVLVLDEINLSSYETVVDGNDSQALAKLIHCDLIDIDCHTIDGQEYDFIVDDVGLFKDKVIPSVIVRHDGSICNFGSIIICRSRGDQEASLSSDDIEAIKKRIKFLKEDADHTELNFPTVFVD